MALIFARIVGVEMSTFTPIPLSRARKKQKKKTILTELHRARNLYCIKALAIASVEPPSDSPQHQYSLRGENHDKDNDCCLWQVG
ncbi:hypothetical protein ACHAXS_001735 [Conticribra weissflogii]